MSFLRLPNLSDLLNKVPALNKYVLGTWTVLDHDSRMPICTFDTFLGYEFTQDNNVMSHPIEQGSFASYNKMSNPARMNVYLARSGYPLQLKNTLESIEEYAESTRLVDIILPFKAYEGYNIEKMNHSIKSGDSGDQIIVELSLVQIKEVTLQYITLSLPAKKVRNPSLADTTNVGKKQGKSLLVKARDYIKGKK